MEFPLKRRVIRIENVVHVDNCNPVECPFCVMGMDLNLCVLERTREIPKSEEEGDMSAPDWCPLRKRQVVVKYSGK